MSGIAWGVEGLSLARTTIGGLRAAFTKAKTESLAMIDDFVKLTQSHDFVADFGDKDWKSHFSDLELEIRNAMNGKIFNSLYWLLVNFQNFTRFNRILLRWLRTGAKREKIGTEVQNGLMTRVWRFILPSKFNIR
ncbi:MAG: hypothetical protein IPK68_19615 [Bdellovibrionales bacterium]|nr:hypothetical protein [Bdellovibrionales bacterium]